MCMRDRTARDRFVKPEKGDFLGKAALLKRIEDGPRKKLVTLKVDATNAPARGGASLMRNGKVVGTITSGDWGYRVGMNLSYTFFISILAAPCTNIDFEHLGDCVRTESLAQSHYDSDYIRLAPCV